MSDDWTPTTGDVLEAWAARQTHDQPTALDLVDAYDSFNRWLAAHDAGRVRELQRSVRELQATRDTYREHWRRLMRDYEAVFKERDELEAERDAAREQVRQRDEVIERVRELANESERDEWDAVERILPAIRAALDGDGR